MTDSDCMEMIRQDEAEKCKMDARWDAEHGGYVGECTICGADIWEDDTDYIIHDASGLGICVRCLDECSWR